jgi:hypothetical protein
MVRPSVCSRFKPFPVLLFFKQYPNVLGAQYSFMMFLRDFLSISVEELGASQCYHLGFCLSAGPGILTSSHGKEESSDDEISRMVNRFVHLWTTPSPCIVTALGVEPSGFSYLVPRASWLLSVASVPGT